MIVPDFVKATRGSVTRYGSGGAWFAALAFGFFLAQLPATTSFANVTGSLRGAYDYGQVDDGTSGKVKADNAGYSGEAALGYAFSLGPSTRLALGGFYLVDSSKTQKIKAGAPAVQNFSISPQGYGVDMALRFTALFFHAGYGYYTAEARKVADTVGRKYALQDGKGPHAGVGYVLRTQSGPEIFFDYTYRQIAYGKLNLKPSAGSDLTLDANHQWHQNILSLGIGVMMGF